jgi:GT2 family glycosyltransferase
MITRNRCASAVAAVRSLAALPDRPPIIVVDNGSSDGTAAALSREPKVRLVSTGRNLGAAGRTLGARLATTPYVAFTDDDSGWAPGALTAAADAFDRHPRLAVLVGRVLVGADQGEDPLNSRLAAAPAGRDADLPGPTALGFLACAAVVRRSAFLAAGGFHPRFGVGGEEQLLVLDLLAAGWGLAYVPDVVAFHRPDTGHARPDREVRMLRNQLWTAWLRHRLGTALAITGRTAWAARRDPISRRALAELLGGLRWILPERRPVPRSVARQARQARPARQARQARPARPAHGSAVSRSAG